MKCRGREHFCGIWLVFHSLMVRWCAYIAAIITTTTTKIFCFCEITSFTIDARQENIYIWSIRNSYFLRKHNKHSQVLYTSKSEHWWVLDNNFVWTSMSITRYGINKKGNKSVIFEGATLVYRPDCNAEGGCHGAIGCDSRPRHCRRDDIPAWRPNKITLLSLIPLNLAMYNRFISFLRAAQSREGR